MSYRNQRYVYGSTAEKYTIYRESASLREITQNRTYKKSRVRIIFCILLVSVLFGSIVFKYMSVFNLNAQLTNENNRYTKILSDNTKLGFKLNTKMGSNEIIQRARRELKMQFPTDKQKVPVTIKRGDLMLAAADLQGTASAEVTAGSEAKAEAEAGTNESSSFIGRLINKVSSFFS